MFLKIQSLKNTRQVSFSVYFLQFLPVSGANQFWPKNLKGRFSDPGHRSSLISMVLSAAGGNHQHQQHQQHHHCHQHHHQPGQRSPLISLALAARIALISPPIKTG